MNFQALHFSSEDEFDDSSVDSYESSDEEEGMVGGLFSQSKDPETESFLKKLFYYSHMDGDDVAFEIKPGIDDATVAELIKKRDEKTMLMKFVGTTNKKNEYKDEQKVLQKQIDDLQQTKKMEKFDIRVLHYIDVLMQIKTCKAGTSTVSMNEFDKTNNKLNKETLKWLYHEYITDEEDKRKIFYENVLFHDTSFRYDETYTNIFKLMNHYYFLYFSCYKIHEDPKYPNKMKKKGENIGSTYEKINKALNLKKVSGFIKTKIEKIMNFLNTKTRDAILSYVENSKKDIGPHDIQIKENSSTENIRETISNFLNNEYKTNNTIDNFEIYDKFWKQKEHQYENISLDKKDVPNKYPFLIINQRKHTVPRFNIVFHKDTYAENVKRWFELCHTYEFTPISAENTMGLTEQHYNGLNVTFAYDYKEYYPFEIRFHTLETFMMKEIPHYHLERLGEDMNKYSFEFKFKNGKQFGINITANNPPEIIEPIINNIIGLFEKLKQKFESTSHNEVEYKKNDDEMEEPVDFVNYITNEEKTLTKHQYKTILYFLIANQSEEDLKLALGKKKKSSDFDEFEKIYKDLKDTQFENKYLYDEILNSIFSNYLEYLKEKMYTYDVTNIIANKLIPRYIHLSADIRKFIQQHEIYHLKSQLQKICNDNMILKHFIPNDSVIRFDIKESKTPPEEPFNPFPKSLGYELIVNKYMELVMNTESVETTPLQPGEVKKPNESETQEDNSEEEETNQDNEEEEEQENEGKKNAVVGQQVEPADTNLERKNQNETNSLNQIIQTKDPTKPMTTENADMEEKIKENEKEIQIHEINKALEELKNSKGNHQKKEKLNKLMSEISEKGPVENIDDKIKAILETNNQIPPGIESISVNNGNKETTAQLSGVKQNEARPPSNTMETL